MKIDRGALAALGAASMLVYATAPAYAAELVADWGMEELPGATVMVDSSANGLNADIGSAVVLHELASETSYGYRFKGDWRVVNDERLVTVQDDPRLDPGTGTYAVTLRFKTGGRDSNVLQKGQAKQTGGFWKIEIHEGWPKCHFRDETGRTRAIGFQDSVLPETKVDDTEWHTLRCERLATGVRITLEYGEPNAITRFIRGTTGNIDSRRPLVIGGKLDCDGTTVTCDYFPGVVDWVRIERP